MSIALASWYNFPTPYYVTVKSEGSKFEYNLFDLEDVFYFARLEPGREPRAVFLVDNWVPEKFKHLRQLTFINRDGCEVMISWKYPDKTLEQFKAEFLAFNDEGHVPNCLAWS